MLKDFFRKGFYTNRLEKSVCDEILRIIKSIKFIASQDYRDAGYKPPLIAEWDDIDGPVVSAHNCQEDLKKYWLKFRELLGSLEKITGNFDSGSVIVNYFPSGHGMNWHSDTVDTSFVQMLIYLSKDEFKKEDGGYLQIGNNIILPNHSTIVIMNNLIPTMLHRVEPLTSEKERLTVVLRYGYMNNTLTKKRSLTMKGEIRD
jgi:hypothetical protein